MSFGLSKHRVHHWSNKREFDRLNFTELFCANTKANKTLVICGYYYMLLLTNFVTMSDLQVLQTVHCTIIMIRKS